MGVAGAPGLKDAMTAVVGGGISLGGLLLIFVGFLFAQAAALAYASSPTPKPITQRYRALAVLGIIPFSLALLTALAALAYWFAPSPALAHWVLAAFAFCVVVSIIYGVVTALKL